MFIISDIAWNEIKKVLPEKKSKVGRKEKDARLVLSGIFYIMKTGVQWHYLPSFYGKPTTIHGRFMKWVKKGLFVKLLDQSIKVAINHLGPSACFITDTSSHKSPFAKFAGNNPTDRGKYGVKRGMIIDWNRIILSIIIDSAKTHDSKLLLPHLNNITKFVNKPVVVVADSAWDAKYLRSTLAKKNIVLHAATNRRRNKNKKKIKVSGRWKIEQVFGIAQWNRGLKTCWTKTKESFLAFCQFAACFHNFKLAGIFG